MTNYRKNSLSLRGAVSLGTGVMIGAGIFALLGQVAELAGKLFPVAFLAGTLVAGFSAYSYIKLSNAYPSAGGIAMYLKKAYGKGIITAFAALLMAFSMIINESLVARTFGTYTLQLFNSGQNQIMVPVLGVLLIIGAVIINISGNELIEKSSLTMSAVKIGGIATFAIAALWVSGFKFDRVVSSTQPDQSVIGFIGAIALSILAYKGFTTITNSGGEIKKPHINVSRAIIISLIICTVVYLLVALAVSANLTIPEIIKARDYSLAEAAKPALGKYGLWFTVGIAIFATISGIIASIFAVSRMTTMLTEMKLIPHSHFGMPGNVQKHMVIYIAVLAILLTIFFDLSRIASLGAILYLVMDIVIHWGVYKYLRKEIEANSYIILSAIVLDIAVLASFLWIKASSDWLVVIIAFAFMILVYISEKLFLSKTILLLNKKNTSGNGK
jgi:amino acid transporter